MRLHAFPFEGAFNAFNEDGFFVLAEEMHLCCKMILPQNLNRVTGSKRTKCALQYASHWALLKEKFNCFEDKMPPGNSPTRILPPKPTIEKVDLTYFIENAADFFG